MSFKKRALTVRISLQRGEKFSNGSDELALTGYRAEAVIENVGAESNAAGVMNLRIYGMRLEDMLVLSTGGLKTDTVRNDFIILSAGNEGEVIRQIFAGSIINAFIDFNGAPDVAFNVMAASGWVDRIKPEAANSYKGQVDVAIVPRIAMILVDHPSVA